ncbi:hypothetical protein Tco_1549404 [Tanacetum coccineum]
MNYILKGIPNDIYNSVDACLDAKQMWARIKRLMQGSDISQQERHSRLMNKFDKFVAVKRESLTSVYERFSTTINVMDQNNVRPQSIFINTKFLNSLQPEWSKYVTMTRQNYTLKTAEYDELFEPHVNASKAKKADRNIIPVLYNAREMWEDAVMQSQAGMRGHVRAINDRSIRESGDGEELNAAVIMMARIQPTNNKSDAKPTYDDEFISEVNALQFDMINGLLSKSDHEQRHHEKLETIIHTYADDQIDFDFIYDDLHVENNSGQVKHDTNAHDQSLHDFESLIINVQVKVEKQRKMNIKLKKKKRLLQRELETCKERIKEFKINPEQALDYKEAYEELQNELNVGKEEICEEILKTQDETLKIKRETDLYKKAFKEIENKYHEDIVSL